MRDANLGGVRTTLDIDPRVLAVARARVRAGQDNSIGEAVSSLALAGLAARGPGESTSGGLVLLPSVPGHVVTDELVAESLLDD
jgi:hypothetical protein